MNNHSKWLIDIDSNVSTITVDGLMHVDEYDRARRPPEEVVTMEKAAAFGAHSVFFEAEQNGRSSVAQAFIFVSDGTDDDVEFAEKHKRLWSWGGVPLIYRKTPALIQLFRCAHKPDFVSKDGTIVCNPIETLEISASIADGAPWWDAELLRNGALWDDSEVCSKMLSAKESAHRRLIQAVSQLNADLNQRNILQGHLRRRLLILSLLTAYLEERGAFEADFFGKFLDGATRFFQVLANGNALVNLLGELEKRFNGHVFTFSDADIANLKSNNQLKRYAKLIEAREELNGQLTLWQLYSFKDLPVEIISHIYQLFVEDSSSSVYTPPFLVRLILEETLSWERLDRLQEKDEVILDPACGSGVFLVEAYKRLVLHWRVRNQWERPGIPELKRLITKVHGIDLELGAVELTAFSLCLALCDALEPEEIRASIKLFPQLVGDTLHKSCFFEAKEKSLINKNIGVVVGNPPFKSTLSTDGAERSYKKYNDTNTNTLPDKQLAYLFLHEAMELIAKGGVLSMLQNYNFLYNPGSLKFRRQFFNKWDVREILDFISVRGLFSKGDADTKIIVIVANASSPEENRKILHATFRRNGRVSAEQKFDIDYYDFHWLPRELILANDGVWRANLLGGGRVLSFVNRLKSFRTLRDYAEENDWNYGEGYIQGNPKKIKAADHIIGMSFLPSEALTLDGVDSSEFIMAPDKPIESPRSRSRFTPPMLLIREQMDIPHVLWERGYLTYKNQIVGFAAPKKDRGLLLKVDQWLCKETTSLRAYIASTSAKLFTQKATTLTAADIFSLPYPDEGTLDLSPNEQILSEDIVNYQREFVRTGQNSEVMRSTSPVALTDFTQVFTRQINSIYKKNPIRALEAQSWPGAICQPFVFGDGDVDWTGADGLREKLDKLLHEQIGSSLNVTRIVRIYDGNFIFLLKSDRLRYWLRSIALRDADDTLADLRAQGF